MSDKTHVRLQMRGEWIEYLNQENGERFWENIVTGETVDTLEDVENLEQEENLSESLEEENARREQSNETLDQKQEGYEEITPANSVEPIQDENGREASEKHNRASDPTGNIVQNASLQLDKSDDMSSNSDSVSSSTSKKLAGSEQQHPMAKTSPLSPVQEEMKEKESAQGYQPSSRRAQISPEQLQASGIEQRVSKESDYSDPSNRVSSSSGVAEYQPEFTPLLQKVEGNYRMFAPVRASAMPGFKDFGDVSAESYVILEMIRRSLEMVNQSMYDLVRVDVRLVDVQTLLQFDEVYEQYFAGVTIPQRNVVGVESMENGCTVEVEVTSFIDSTTPRIGRKEESVQFDTGMQLANGPPADYGNAPPSLWSFLGDILPPRIAQAYGYYGEKQEQVLSGLTILTFIRYCLLLFAVIIIALIETSDYELVFINFQQPVRGPSWAIAVASMMLAHSLILCVYGFMWWYQGDEADQCVEVSFYWIMIALQYFGDFAFVFLSFSAFTSLATLCPFTPNDGSSRTRSRFISATVLCFFTWLVYIFTFRLSNHSRKAFNALDNKFRLLRESSLKPNEMKNEGVTTPRSQNSSAFNTTQPSQNNRLITPASISNSQQYGTPLSMSHAMPIHVPGRSSTPGSHGSSAQLLKPGSRLLTQHSHSGHLQMVPPSSSGTGPAQLSTPNSQGHIVQNRGRLVSQTSGNMPSVHHGDTSAPNPNQMYLMQQYSQQNYQGENRNQGRYIHTQQQMQQ